MKSLFLKIVLFLFIGYIIFFSGIYIFNKEAKFISIDDLKKGEDFFYFFWIFIIPFIIEILIVGFPIYFSFEKFLSNKTSFYLIISIAFFLNFLLYKWVFNEVGIALIRVLINMILFVIFFRKKIFT